MTTEKPPIDVESSRVPDAPQAPPSTGKALAVREPAGAIAPHQGNPLDMEPALFRAGLDRRKSNRDALMEWIRSNLKEGVDYGKIHNVGKTVCSRGKYCTDPAHFSRDILFKPGSEKICGMLGIQPTFPTLRDYEEACLKGVVIKNVLLRCEMVDAGGKIVAVGVGARSLEKDYGDLNKSLKMAEKSAQLDATLRMGGLSELFTIDLEDMDPEASGNGQQPAPSKSPRTAEAARQPRTTGPAARASQPTTAKAEPPDFSAQWKKRFEDKLKAEPDLRVFAWDWAQSTGNLLPNEPLGNMGARFFPQNMVDETKIWNAIRAAAERGATPELEAAFKAAYTRAKGEKAPKPEPPPPPEPEAPPEQVELPKPREGADWWREHQIHFGQNKGVKVGDIPKNKLKGWWSAYAPTPHPRTQQLDPRDVTLRQAFDAAGEFYHFSDND